MRSLTVLMPAVLFTALVYSPELLACGNAMEGEALVSGARQALFASVSGVAVAAAGVLFFFRLRRSKD